MDWASMLGGTIAALAFAIGLPLALRKRRKGGGVGRGWEGRCEGVIKIGARNIDYILG